LNEPVFLFVLSADFGEFVTANLFARGQPFDSHFALPPRLAPHAPAGWAKVSVYNNPDEIQQLVDGLHPEWVVLCSGYLFAVNSLMAPERLATFIKHLRDQGVRVVTTDPWLGIWRNDPQACFDIFSVRLGRADTVLSKQMNALQQYLNGVFQDIEHLYAVPLNSAGERQHSFFNPAFAPTTEIATEISAGQVDDWLMILSHEDYVMLARPAASVFLANLTARIDEILGNARNRLNVIGPVELQTLFRERWPTQNRLRFHGFCSFSRFELLLRRARVVVYWNVLSSSLLYCLYYRIAPIFLGTGHQVKVCRGLLGHVIENVYRGNAPPVLDPSVPLEADVGLLIDKLGIMRWLDSIRVDYLRLPAPVSILDRIGSNA
jgi:hypothetical protein